MQKIDLKAIVNRIDVADPKSVVMAIKTKDCPTVRPSEAVMRIFDLPESVVKRARIIKQPV